MEESYFTQLWTQQEKVGFIAKEKDGDQWMENYKEKISRVRGGSG